MISFSKIASLKGNVVVPADKSITHRSIIFSAMAEGNSEIINPLISRDTLATMNGMKAVGVEFIPIESGFKVVSKGYKEFKEADNIINCENSGTTARLLTGLFAPQKKYFVFTGDDSLRKRPMDRVQKPLYRMGANIVLRGNRYLPMTILPSDIYPAEIEAEVNSAQVKSAVLLAGCQIEGVTSYLEKENTRNHTEMMLKDLGAEIVIEGKKISIKGPIKIKGERFVVPGDFSSAAFFIGSALMFENAEIVVKGVGLNPTRTGLIDVLRRFGVNIELSYNDNRSEPTGDIYLKNQRFSGGKIAGDIIPNIIDEIPLIATLGLFADSPIEIRDAEELRVKESDRISSVVYNIKQIGGKVEEFDDGLKVYPLEGGINRGGLLKSFHDHRIAMINILLSKRFGEISIDEIDAIDVSFPDFLKKLKSLEVVIA